MPVYKTTDKVGRVHYADTVKTIELTAYDITVCGLVVPETTPQIAYDPTAPIRGLCKLCDRYAHTEWTDGLTATQIRAREAAR